MILSRLGSTSESHRIAKWRQESRDLFCHVGIVIYVVQNGFGSSYQDCILITSVDQIGLILITSHRITKYGQEPVYVADYQYRPSGERIASFQFLQGASVAFQQRLQSVPEELPRGAVGFLDQRGLFFARHSLGSSGILARCVGV